MFSRFTIVAAVLAGTAYSTSPAATKPEGLPDLQSQIDSAIQKGAEFLLEQVTEEGPVSREYSADYKVALRGWQTAMTVHALLSAKVPPDNPKLARAIKWLMEAKLHATRAVAARACALAELNDPKVMPVLAQDAKWLINAAGADGAYTYAFKAGATDGPGDNTNTQLALLGVSAAYHRGIAVPSKYWRLMQDYWMQTQRFDGGWNYRSGDKRTSYGSTTAAGLASLLITQDALYGTHLPALQLGKPEEHMDKAIAWIENNFSVEANPNKGPQWWYSWLYSLERVALASGFRRFAGRDWYRLGAEQLVKRQSEAGYWHSASRLDRTALAILFLSCGRRPVLISKLKYQGRWNTRPRDVANLARWIGLTFESPVGWQTVDINSDTTEWHDAPILYISGAGACNFTPQQMDKLRDYTLQGGLILSEAAASSGDFTLDMHEYYRQTFPEFSMRRLAEDDDIYDSHFRPKGIRGLEAVSNGLRPLVIHSPSQLSSSLQAGYRENRSADRSVFELLANIYLRATDKGILRQRGHKYWPDSKQFTPASTAFVTPVKHAANWNPEPMALARLGIEMGNTHSIALEVRKPVELAKLDAQTHPIAVMTGQGELSLSTGQVDALRRYFREGGTLVIDSAGGSREFDRCVYGRIIPLVPDGLARAIPEGHEIFSWPNKIPHPTYRRDLAMALGKARRKHRLRGVWSGEHLAIIYSREDLTGGLVGYQQAGLRGYAPQTAMKLMTNILAYAAGDHEPRATSGE